MITRAAIAEVLAAIATIERLVVAGECEREIAKALAWRTEDLRAAAKAVGLSLSPMAPKPVLCPRCGHHREWLSEKTGWCAICNKQHRMAKLAAVYEEEERRLDEAVEREIDVIKKRGQRMREEYGTNPRKSVR